MHRVPGFSDGLQHIEKAPLPAKKKRPKRCELCDRTGIPCVTGGSGGGPATIDCRARMREAALLQGNPGILLP